MELRIMVADDSLIMIRKNTALLEELGHKVVASAKTGNEAIALFEEFKPDLVTMDITMPELDGIEATKAIIEKHPNAKIIMVTSHGQEGMIMNAIDAGAKGYVMKPFSKEKFEEAIDIAFSD